MAQYEVGNILLQIVSDVKNTNSSIDSTTKSLNKLKNSFKGIEKININTVKNNLEHISKLDLSNISNAFKPLEALNQQSFKTFNSITKALTNITRLETKDINFDKITEQITNLTKTVDPFVTKIKEAEPALQAFSNALNLGKVYSDMSVAQARIEKIRSTMMSASQIDIINSNKVKKSNAQLQITEERLKRIQEKSEKASFSFSKVFNIGKIYFWLNYTKRAGQALTNMLTSAIDFDETLNKFQVSMGDYYEQSIKFVNSLTYAFNLSAESIMNYQATFKNMLDAIGGLSPGSTYGLSETLTRMAIDYASLFNVSIDRAMEQFQSVLSGQIRSIRSTSGYDVSEASIFAIYQSLGGTKTMRQLDQIEKRLLRILAVQQQMERTGAVSDFEKTINNSANILKQTSETWKEIGRWMGQLASVYFEPLLEKVLVASIVIREMLKSLAIAQGYQYEAFGQGGLFGEIESSADSATDSVNELKKSLLGFDQLNILGSSSSGIGSDYKLLTDQIKSYASNLDDITNKANEQSEKLLEWLGYHKQINTVVDEQGNEIETIVWNLDDGNSKLKDIKDTIGAIVLSLAAFGIGGKISSIAQSFGGIKTTISNITKTFGGITGKITGIVAVVLILASAFKTAYDNNEEFRESVDETLQGIKDNLKEIWDNTLKPILDDFDGALEGVWKWFSEQIGPAIEGCLKFIQGITDLMKGDMKSAVKNIGEGFASWGESIKKFFEFDTIFGKKENETSASYEKGGILYPKGSKESQEFWDWFGGGNLSEQWDYVSKQWDKVYNKINDFLGIDTDKVIDNIKMQEEYSKRYDAYMAGTLDEYMSGKAEEQMSNAITNSMGSMVSAIVNGDRQIIEAINNSSNRSITLNGRKVSQEIYDDLEEEGRRRGKPVFA